MPTTTLDTLDTLKYKNPHERDARIEFDPVPHKYTIDGNVDPGAAYTSVTTWNHSHFEQFDADAVIAKMMASKNWATNVKYRGKTSDQIKAEWDLNRDQAAAAGTEMHAAIELYYNRSEQQRDQVVDQVVDQRGTRDLATAYLEFLWSDEGQKLAVKHYFRPRSEKLLAENAAIFPAIQLAKVDEVFGGWAAAQKTHFADGGIFDQIYQGK